MKHLDRYILRQFVKYIIILMAVFITIYILIDFFEKIDNFLEKGKPMSLAMKYFLLNIPFILEQMGPVCILLAGVITLGILNHSNELIALKAGGIPLRRIIYPVIFAGLGISFILLTMSQFILPMSVASTNKIWNEEVKGRVPLGIYRNGRYYYQSKDGFYSFLRPDPKKNAFHHFSFSSWNKDYQLDTLVTGSLAVWKGNSWTLFNGQVQQLTDQGKYRTEMFRFRQFNFPDKPVDFFVPLYRSLELSLTGLFLEAKHKQTKAEETKAWVDFYGRIFYILLGLPLLLLGLPLVLIIYRKWSKDLSLAIPASCGLAFVCWGLWGTLQSLAKAGYVAPLAAASSVHFVVGSIGIYLLLREDS